MNEEEQFMRGESKDEGNATVTVECNFCEEQFPKRKDGDCPYCGQLDTTEVSR